MSAGHDLPALPEINMNLPFISDSLPQFPSQNRSLNAALVLQELTLPRICPKYVEARLRGPESAGPRFSSTYLDCPVESVIGLITAFAECLSKRLSIDLRSSGVCTLIVRERIDC